LSFNFRIFFYLLLSYVLTTIFLVIIIIIIIIIILINNIVIISITTVAFIIIVSTLIIIIVIDVHIFFFIFTISVKSKAHGAISVITNAVPGFVKSSVLGTTLFFVYDSLFEPAKIQASNFIQSPLGYSYSYLYTGKNVEKESTERNGNLPKISPSSNYMTDSAGNSLFVVAVTSLFVGGLGGTAHATLHVTWDSVMNVINNIGNNLLFCILFYYLCIMSEGQISLLLFTHLAQDFD
jgi:hypothetical protein